MKYQKKTPDFALPNIICHRVGVLQAFTVKFNSELKK